MSIFIYPYKAGSRSARALANALDARIIRREGSSFIGNKSKIVINWGSSVTPEEIEKATVINTSDAVKLAGNKKSFFEAAEGSVSIPDFTTDYQEAENWSESGAKVVVREKLSGHSGEGIVLLDAINDWERYDHSRAKLYVKYIPKSEEYRIHVVGNGVADVQQKARNTSVPDRHINWQIRNHHNGFIYKRENVNPPDGVLEEAVRATQVCGLHYGAVDVIWNRHRNQAYVLEVNTAPGLEGSTVDNISSHINNLIGGLEIVQFVPNRTILRDDQEQEPYRPQRSRPAITPMYRFDTNLNEGF